MASVNRVKIMVDGKSFTLIGQESTEHIQQVASYIDKKMKEVRGISSSLTIDASLAYVLTSLNVGDDYFKALEEKEALMSRLKEAQEYLDEIDDNWRKAEEKMRANQERLQETGNGVQVAYDNLQDEYQQLQNTTTQLLSERENFQKKITWLEDELDKAGKENDFLNEEKNLLDEEKNLLEEEKNRLEEMDLKRQQDSGMSLEIQKMQELEIKALREQLEESESKVKKLERIRLDYELRTKNLDKARLEAENKLDAYLMALEDGSYMGNVERGQNRIKNRKR